MPKHERDGAPSVIESDQAAFVEDAGEPRHGKHFAGGRKVVDLEHVGGTTPDADPAPAPAKPSQRADK